MKTRAAVAWKAGAPLTIETVDLDGPRAGEVLVEVKATGICHTDQYTLSGADPEGLFPAILGHEGAGIVVDAGSEPQAQALKGKTVAILGGAMYGQYRALKAKQCLVLPPGTTPAEGASCFVNPLTALGLVETMRSEGHRALVHTAAASNLGQMLNRICLEDGIDLVNVVRKPEQAALLRSQGAKFVVDTSAQDFEEALLAAIDVTGATIAFDAVGGGRLAGQILTAMETSLARKMMAFSPDGSTRHKQVYSYGVLDSGPAVLERARFGMAWSFGGWLLTHFLQKAGAETVQRLKQRVASNLKTTFASAYTKDVSLAQALSREEIAIYSKRATAAKYLVCPNKDL